MAYRFYIYSPSSASSFYVSSPDDLSDIESEHGSFFEILESSAPDGTEWMQVDINLAKEMIE